MSAAEQRLVAEAAQLLQQGQNLAARQRLEQASKLPGAARTTWQWLANACVRDNDLPNARVAIERAIQIGPVDGSVCLTAANICQDAGDVDAALHYAELSAKVEPTYAQGINNLGILLADRQRYDESIAAFERAIVVKPDYARAYANLAATLMKLDRYEPAFAAASHASRLQPDYAYAHYMCGVSAFSLGRNDDALAALQRALQRDPRMVDAWMQLAKFHRREQRVDAAGDALQRALALAPQRVDAKTLFAEILWVNGQYEQARALWREVLAAQPTQLEAALRLALSVPGIYADAAAVDGSRDAFTKGVTDLLAHANTFANAAKNDVVRDIQTSNFFLAYQGRDDTALQRGYAAFVAAVLQPYLPQFFAPIAATHLPTDQAPRRVRVGFVSRLFHISTAGHYFASWVTDLPREHFEVVVNYTNLRADALTEKIRARADEFTQQDMAFEKLAAAVKDANLDVLVYPELGMEPKLYALAALRLAPVQVCGWGHPVTSGHANIDYYLSCAAMEPANAAQHYNEKLHLLPGLGTRYPLPVIENIEASKKQRADFQLPENKTLYLLPQSLFKIHPDNDQLITRLLKADANSVLVLFTTHYPSWTQIFIERLQRAFAAAGLAPEGRVKLLPNLSHDEFKRVNQLCDVMIDTLYWSGGNTSLDALAMGLPMVTLPGEFMRGRQSAAMLSMLGLNELIASDAEDYLRIAHRLGTETEYRNAMRARILDNRHTIFDDPAPTRALAEFLQAVVSP